MYSYMQTDSEEATYILRLSEEEHYRLRLTEHCRIYRTGSTLLPLHSAAHAGKIKGFVLQGSASS